MWDNGQIMLVDIARREGLKYGPNGRMQTLMVKRNEEILAVVRTKEKRSVMDRRIAAINKRYTTEITKAAREFPDRPINNAKSKNQTDLTTIIVVICCAVVVTSAVACATCLILRSRRKQNDIATFQGDHVVVGNPVSALPDAVPGVVQGGTPVTVAAPMKAPRTDAKVEP